MSASRLGESTATLSTMRSQVASTLSTTDLDRWGKEEKAQVLAHYGLETLFPEVWEDVREGQQQGGEQVGEQSKANSATSLREDAPGPGPVRVRVVDAEGKTTEPSGEDGEEEPDADGKADELYVNPLVHQVDFSDPLGIKGSIWQ
jgi:hypothetical protein